MLIKQEACVGCGQCMQYCIVHAISIINKKAYVNLDTCTECGSCLRSGACKTGALYQQELVWPRTIRSQMSNVFTEYKGVAGRGTEEMKTNDVTGRFKRGYCGIALEMGRPGVGARFKDIQYMAQICAKHGAEFEDCNPITSYLVDKEKGIFDPAVMGEFVISGIIEVLVPNEKFKDLVADILEGAKHIDTVFSMDVACPCEEDNTVAAQKMLDEMGIWYRPNCKTCVGLGRPLAKI